MFDSETVPDKLILVERRSSKAKSRQSEVEKSWNVTRDT